MTTASAEPIKDQCYRCGYDLRGFTNDQACPECGLLAERSRRPSDELHDTRPRWLRSLSWGIIFILLAIAAPFVGPPLAALILNLYPQAWYLAIGLDLAAIFLFLAVIFLTRKEGYPPADLADHRLRTQLRWMTAVPLLAALLLHLEIFLDSTFGISASAEMICATAAALSVSFAVLPLLLFLRLRGLAVRARSAHLVEHCTIVGIGTSASMLYITAAAVILYRPDWFGLDENWTWRSGIALLMQLLFGVAAILFILWSLYLLTRFALAFWFAARQLRQKWSRDDRSLITSPVSHDGAHEH
jgi:hypothetical protein